MATPKAAARPLLLASASRIRLQLLRYAGLDVTATPVRVDEAALRDSLLAEGASPRDVADALAETKATRLALKNPTALVLGCDQVLAHEGRILGKPDNPDAARAQLLALRGKTHHLLSAAVLYENAQPVWRHISRADLVMRNISDSYLDDYLHRNWPSLAESVGGYKLEEEGVRLFSAIAGDHFTILGLPLIPLLDYLGQRRFIAT